VLIFLKTQIP